MEEPIFDFVYGATRGGRNFRADISVDDIVEDMSQVRVTVEADGYTTELRDLVELLQTSDGVKMLKDAFHLHMLYKVETYQSLYEDAMVEAEEQLARINMKLPELKRVAAVRDEHDNWNIFQSMSTPYIEAQDRATIFQNLKLRAEEQLGGSMGVENVRSSSDVIYRRRDQLVEKLKHLANFHAFPACIYFFLRINGHARECLAENFVPVIEATSFIGVAG